jgi:glycosyltransferase involved in cell wall biosynthesis
MRKRLARGFGVYFDGSKSTSGQRFFATLHERLTDASEPLEENPEAILFNVSAPFGEILRAKLRRQRIVLRIDGLYFDRLSAPFLSTFSRPVGRLLSLGMRYRGAHDVLASLANLLNENYSAFARILLADRVVYQSQFSRVVHERYFRSKPFDVIVNGSDFSARGAPVPGTCGTIRLVTIYDEWKPAKRIDSLVEFVRWANESERAAIQLTILGYTGKTPLTASASIKDIIETAPYIRTVGRFESFDEEIRRILLDQHIYVTFSYRDPCPNSVIEAMAHGLPVVAYASGGIPDIVEDAGVLIPLDDFENGFFCCHRYENAFPPLDFAQVLGAIAEVVNNLGMYRARVERRFAADLGVSVVAERYANVLKAAAEYGS